MTECCSDEPSCVVLRDKVRTKLYGGTHVSIAPCKVALPAGLIEQPKICVWWLVSVKTQGELC